MTKSIYDQLNAYGTVAKQRFVETFSGSALDTDRWTTNILYNASTFAMSDSVDGGFEITTGATNSDRGGIDFNDKRQYAHNGSVCITVVKIPTITSVRTEICGFYGNGTGSINSAYIGADTSTSSNYKLGTTSATTNSETVGSIAYDTAYHTYKVECGSSNVINYIDNVTDVTKTTNLPASSMQPIIACMTRTSASRTLNVNYVECYNT
jgi:hypothetical protein